MLNSMSVAGYRSVVDVRLSLSRVTVVLGANGTGKSNLYRSLTLLQAAAAGRLGAAFAAEGGFGSALWAGGRGKGPVRMRFSAGWDDLDYSLDLGLPPPTSPFPLDPEVKLETISLAGSSAVLAQRKGASAMVRADDGSKVTYPFELWPGESLLAKVSDPQRLAVLSDVRERIGSWRAYHHFRTDPGAPARTPQPGSFTPVLAADGSDIAAALATIREVGDARALRAAVSGAFPDAEVSVHPDERGYFLLELHREGLSRPLAAAELSDGTLRFLCLAAALLSPRPPELMALNEPETSLHPDLLDPLADLITTAAERSQVWVTTHSEPLAEFLADRAGASVVRIAGRDGRTELIGDDRPRWGD